MKGGLVTLVMAAPLIVSREVPALESSLGVGVGYVKADAGRRLLLGQQLWMTRLARNSCPRDETQFAIR